MANVIKVVCNFLQSNHISCILYRGILLQMFAFVGYIVHANGITWPWAMTLAGDPFPKVSSAPEAWDAIPEAGRWQIMLAVGALEMWREAKSGTHYMKGGKIGYYPPFESKKLPPLYGPIPRKDIAVMDDATKARRLNIELNNGRLAQLGIFGFLCEQTIPGSVPLLSGVAPPYSGEVMAPLDSSIFGIEKLLPALN